MIADNTAKPKCHVRPEQLGRPTRVFIDPNKLSEDDTVSLDSYEVTEDGKYLAYGTCQSGSDCEVVHFMDVTTAKDLQDVLYDSKWPSIEWSPDGKGIFYVRFPKNAQGSMVTENSRMYY